MHTQQPKLDFGPEWALLELLCHGLRTPEQLGAFERLANDSALDWGILLEQALRHRLAHMLGFYTAIGPLKIKIPPFARKTLLTLLYVNRHQTSLLRNEAARVIQAFQRRGIPIVGTKGIVFESTLYEGNATRTMGDIDFMTQPAYTEAAAQILDELGYQALYYDEVSDQFLPMDRKQIMVYKMSPDHLPRLTRLTGDPVVPFIATDIATSFTWARSKYDVPLDAAFASLKEQPIPGVENVLLPSFQPEYHFLFTILHFFREAWFLRHLESEKDVNLIKCADIIRCWNVNPQLHSRAFGELIERYGLEEPVLWVLEHIDRSFGTAIVPALEIAAPITEEWLSSASNDAVGTRLFHWRGTMRERLYSKDRRQLFA